MSKRRIIFIAINLVLFLTFFAWNVYRKEQTLKDGKLILLELAPVDPRSLFQGDYMRLDYAISRLERPDFIPQKGYFLVVPDSNGIVKEYRIQEEPAPLRQNEFPLRYTVAKDMFVKIGADSYFFEEGNAAAFDSAKYGGLKIDKNGVGILVGLYDKNFKLIQSQKTEIVKDSIVTITSRRRSF